MTQTSPMAWNPEWWSDAWWEDPDYQAEYHLSLEQIRAAVNALTRLFDERWTQSALDAGPPNAVLPILFGGKGLWPFQNLMWLGRIAAAVSGVPSVHRPLRDLIGERTRATLLELEVASWCVELGWEVEFLKPSRDRRTPDIRVQKNELHSAIECKRFESEQWEDWASELSLALVRRIHDHTGPDAPSFDILFEPRLSDLVWADDSIRGGILDELAHCIDDAVRRALSTTPPTSVRVPGIAHVQLRPERQGAQHGIGGIEVSPQAKMRRIVKNGILEAAQQLKSHAPGAVVIRSDFTPPRPLVDAVLQGINRADKRHLQSVGVVVIPASLGDATVIWQNPVLADHPVCRELAATFATILAAPS